MTFVRFVNFLHECGLDIIALGFLNSVLSALTGKLLEKYGKQLPRENPRGRAVRARHTSVCDLVFPYSSGIFLLPAKAPR